MYTSLLRAASLWSKSAASGAARPAVPVGREKTVPFRRKLPVLPLAAPISVAQPLALPSLKVSTSSVRSPRTITSTVSLVLTPLTSVVVSVSLCLPKSSSALASLPSATTSPFSSVQSQLLTFAGSSDFPPDSETFAEDVPVAASARMSSPASAIARALPPLTSMFSKTS
ncbi:hypothetical protein D9M68_879650 [compost metagenome]